MNYLLNGMNNGSPVRRHLTLFRPGFLGLPGTWGGLRRPAPYNFKISYGMATKFTQNKVLIISNI